MLILFFESDLMSRSQRLRSTESLNTPGTPDFKFNVTGQRQYNIDALLLFGILSFDCTANINLVIAKRKRGIALANVHFPNIRGILFAEI